MTRDPRIDPQEGDVIRKGKIAIVVQWVDAGQVGFQYVGGARCRMPLALFREQALVEATRWRATGERKWQAA